jgi:LacI family transcriptional regulator
MSTVSHVLNGTHYVSPELTERVLQAVKDLGYEQNPVARILAGGRSHVVGVLVPDLFNSYTGEIIRGIDDELMLNNYELMLYTNRRGKQLASAYASTLSSGLVIGLLILVPENRESFFSLLKQRHLPYVLIDPHHASQGETAVDATNRKGAYEATCYLIELGHRRIGFVAGSPFLECAVERLAGYQAALVDHGLPGDRALIVDGDFTQTTAYQAANRLLDLPDPPTAIFAANDASAFGVMDAVRNRELLVPHDMSIIGFDDIPQAAATRPALTTIRQPLTEMGRAAARLLLDIIDDPQRPAERLRLATELIVRESCRSPATIPAHNRQSGTIEHDG